MSSIIEIESSTGSYDIIIEENALARIGECVKNKCVVVVDRKVYGIWSDYINNALDASGVTYNIVEVDGGEINKHIYNVLYMYGEFNRYGITKSDTIVCIGGGVVGDMTAFAAATYLRGVEVVQVPTTLLSMVDSSIGGKSAIDMPFGKNLVGVIKSPSAVLIDKRFLTSLDERQVATGMAEIIKSGLIGDEDILVEAEKDNSDIERLIELSLRVKGGVVMRDEFETGERMVLNLGHTIGHAIEALGKYVKYTHGEAVAIGMYNIAKLTEEKKLTENIYSEKIKNVLIKYDLPYEVNIEEKDEIINTISLDKKNMGKVLKVILVREIGNAEIYDTNLEFFK